MSVTSVQNILDFYKAEGELFDRILPLSGDREVSKHVVVLWMWLQTAGFSNLIAGLKSERDGVLVHIVREAESILRCLKEAAPPPEGRRGDLINTARMVDHDLSLGFFYGNRDTVVMGMVGILDGASRVIFQDELRLAARSVRRGGTVPAALRRALMPESWPEETRTMVVNFAGRHAVGEEELTEYFNGRWGQCVERVMMERGRVPICARVMFNSPSLLPLVFSGQDVQFDINGRQVWARVL